jgi:hypothetical protein
MKNKWKTAFWILLIVFFGVTLFQTYTILDQGTTITYMREGYQDTEYDLEQISETIEGKLKFEDFKEITKRFDDLGDSSSIDLNRVRILFDSDKTVKAVTTKW